MKFSFSEIGTGLFLIEKEYSARTAGHGSDISGPYWMLIEIEILSGRLSWRSNGKEIAAPSGRNFIFLPPFSWTMEFYEAGTRLKVKGLISKSPLHFKCAGPIVFPASKGLPNTAKGVEQLLRETAAPESIATNPSPSSLSARAKKMIDAQYVDGIEIKEIAGKLKTSPAVLSRRFKSDFGQTPVFYRKGLRITVGMFELMMGTAPAESAALAGYADLGRFYKQFKAYLKQTPAEYLKRSKNAKKSK